ncbi:MAG: hypothetical protein ACYDAK_13410 [Candidatus Limnocylindrales bacterium]
MSSLVHPTSSSIQPATTYAVHLTYFKDTGKYYSSGQYRTAHDTLYEIFLEVDEMVQSGQLPGLRQGAHYLTLIDVPEHPHNHPHLIIPENA